MRPTSDKVRQAIFNALQSRIDFDGIACLDVFCGTGALGLEALSRGAASCAFIDTSAASLKLAKENTEAFGVEQASFYKHDATKLPERPLSFPQAGLALIDPPYRLELASPTLQSLKQGGWLADGAPLCC